MNHSDGDKVRMFGKYVEIVPNQRITFTLTWLDLPDPYETVVTLNFKPDGDGTELTLVHTARPGDEMLESASQGWGGCLDMLDKYISGEPPFGG
jgi:uncharacterized protein YndB with AHSA1/START domain